MGPTATLALSPSRAPHAAWLDIAAGLRGLRRAAVRGGLVGRPPSAVFDGSHLAAAAGLQPVAGGLLLVVDVLRRGRYGHAHRLRQFRDPPGSASEDRKPVWLGREGDVRGDLGVSRAI